MTVINVSHVSKSFRGTPLFEDVSFTCDGGKAYGLVGANGTGKSVLFKIICGFIRPDAGTVTLDSSLTGKKRTFPSNFGVIIDGPAYLPFETGLENLRRLAEIQKLIGSAEIRDAMTSVGLDPDLKQPVRRYSLGMKQKLSLAQAFMEQPRVLILDEPFNALDEDSVASVKGLLRERLAQGVTLIFTSHDREDIDDLSDVVLELKAQKLRPRLAESKQER